LQIGSLYANAQEIKKSRRIQEYLRHKEILRRSQYSSDEIGFSRGIKKCKQISRQRRYKEILIMDELIRDSMNKKYPI
jgi:hypothetical protein